MYDAEPLKRLKDEADIGEVCSYLDIKIHRKGGVNYISCPLPEHDDTHPTNCFFKDGDNYVYCMVCNKSINSIDLIMNYGHTDFKHAVETLKEIEGNPEWYPSFQKGSTVKVERPVITSKEAKLINLNIDQWKKYIGKNEFKKLILIKCQSQLIKLNNLELALEQTGLFQERKKVIEEIIKRINTGG